MKLPYLGLLVLASLFSGCGNEENQKSGSEKGQGDPTLLMKCEACGQAISKQAKGCPRCGHPNPDYLEAQRKSMELAEEEAVKAKGGRKTLAKIRKAKENDETELYLYGNQIRDLTPLADLTQLTMLSLYDNDIIDVTPLAGLTNLTELQIYSNQIKDISSLAKLKNLEKLFLSKNKIIDISPLASLTKLEELNLGQNRIVAITPLAGLTNLTELNLEGNITTDTQKAILRKALTNCKISF